VIITVIPMWMMQVAVNQVVKVITVWNALMSTAGAVRMSPVMPSTLMTRSTLIGIRRVDFQNMFVNVIHGRVMQVAIMQIISVTGMNDGHMTAGESVLVTVLSMLDVCVHRDPPGYKGMLSPRAGAEQFVSR
jgi:hypothetical protein